MTNSQHLNQLLSEIAQITGESISESQAKENGHEMYLQLENNATYGGWRLVNVKVINGGHSGAYGGNSTEPRLKYKVMLIKLKGILAGLQTIINKTQNA